MKFTLEEINLIHLMLASYRFKLDDRMALYSGNSEMIAEIANEIEILENIRPKITEEHCRLMLENDMKNPL